MPGTTSFPGALDTFPDIQAETAEDAEGFEHDVVHNNIAAAVAAVQTKLGIDDSEDTTSIDARIAALESAASTVLHYRRTDLVATGGETVLSTVQDPYEGSLELYVDGTLLALDDYTVSGHILTLDNAASGGEVYTVRYLTESSGTTDALWVEALTLTGDFADGTVGEAYESDITITGGDGNYSLTGGDGVASGTLPDGLSLSIVEDSGSHYLRLSGTSTEGYNDTFTVSVDSGDGQTATSEQAMEVTSPFLALLHFDAADGSEVFHDEYGNTWTPTGVAIDTAYAAFGTGSMHIATSGAYLRGPDDLVATDASELTVGMRIRWQGPWNSSYGTILFSTALRSAPGGFSVRLSQGDKKLQLIVNPVESGGAYTFITGSTTVTTNEWHHIEVDIVDGMAYLFLDGELEATGALPDGVSLSNGQALIGWELGGNSSYYAYYGHIDEFYVAAAALHTESFTPPTAPLPPP